MLEQSDESIKHWSLSHDLKLHIWLFLLYFSFSNICNLIFYTKLHIHNIISFLIFWHPCRIDFNHPSFVSWRKGFCWCFLALVFGFLCSGPWKCDRLTNKVCRIFWGRRDSCGLCLEWIPGPKAGLSPFWACLSELELHPTILLAISITVQNFILRVHHFLGFFHGKTQTNRFWLSFLKKTPRNSFHRDFPINLDK